MHCEPPVSSFMPLLLNLQGKSLDRKLGWTPEPTWTHRGKSRWKIPTNQSLSGNICNTVTLHKASCCFLHRKTWLRKASSIHRRTVTRQQRPTQAPYSRLHTKNTRYCRSGTLSTLSFVKKTYRRKITYFGHVLNVCTVMFRQNIVI
jgi:hypothetical protein